MRGFFNCLLAVCVILGSFVGAGFATGKEVFMFYYGANPVWAAVITFALFFLCTFLLLTVGKRFNAANMDDLFNSCFGRYRAFPLWAMMVSYFLVLSTMLAAANMCLAGLFDLPSEIPLFSSLTAVACGYALMHEIKGIKVINAVAVPLIVIFIVYVCCGKLPQGEQATEVPVLTSLSYVCFNVVMMCAVLLTLGKELSGKQSAVVALVASLVITVLLVLILLKLNDEVYSFVPMPLMLIAKEKGRAVFYAASIALYLSVVTTLLSNAYPVIERVNYYVKNKFTAVALTMFAATLFSMVGFTAIIDLSYPVVAIFGIALMCLLAYKTIKMPKNSLL